ncbi:Non-repetitive/WGA-negative nucleoporin C-terminal-domain-containing protein [Pseudomassariella vexata]|uniref:Non-repetitive/WGA-negative nucleoporin C-terminal-domain-containing protein n=1 Tax=Pseudomassariella vexata TaxID=1141098 RepID=A0A1Y2DGF3_9PEZI|nr:Non-repetitive/WGA-negative nucleoporin C-terminal-domain-containing protein [Pseudomassariella vexata]ORY58196.1 Non-repetitive/WGA-negative nucleoporin C-terminal-domain-containing protein [Pseudomassariella vexata]
MSFTQATPMRPVPGAFMNTPAVASRYGAQQDPTRRRLFADQPSNGTGSQSAHLGSQGPFDAPSGGSQALATVSGESNQAAPPRSPLTKAAGYINTALARDEAYPELDTYCRQSSSEYDLPLFDSAWAPFQKTQTYEIPQSVFEQYNTAEVSTMMGLFAELNHAWVTIDNCIYLWDYTHPNPELIGYEDNQHSITAIQLVTPKADVFVKEITHVLAIATTSEMFLLGIAAENQPSGAKTVQLYQTRMSLALKGTEVREITGSSNGRIFFSTQTDTDIYELYYQQEEKWFSGRTGKINHTYPGWSSVVPKTPQLWGTRTNEYIVQIVIDDSRNLLYSLSSNSTIRTYHMEAPDRLTKVIEKTKNDCLRDITHALSGKSTLLSERMDIIAICHITSTEDAKVHLMAVTNTGCRLFMSAASASYMISISPDQAPQSMQLHSIKFPPPETKQTSPVSRDFYGGPSDYIEGNSKSLCVTRKGVRFAPGYFLAFVDKDNRDQLFIAAPDTGRIKNTGHPQNLRYYEQGNWIEVGSRAVDVGLVTKPFGATKRPLGFGNELAVQFDDPASEIAILTNTGIHVVRRRRLVDIFAAAIRTTVGEEMLKAEISKFQGLCGRVEMVTTALAVACGQGNDQRLGTGRGAMDQATEDRARQVFVNFGGNPMLPEQDGQVPTVETVRPSSRHGALTRYLSRLIRTLWRSPVIRVGADASGALAITSTIPSTKLIAVQESLERLRAFLEANKSFIQGLSGPADLQRAGSKQEELAFQGEHQAMHALQVLMAGTSEGISFVLMLFDERVADIYTRLDDDSRQQLRELTYERLFSQQAGKDLAKHLVKAIVNRNIESGSNVETVADALRRRCGSFCSSDDVVIFRAQEQLKRASETGINPASSLTLLAESCRLFQKVAGSLTPANLENAVEQYIALRYFAGAIQLCLTVAHEKDRGNKALSWINDRRPANDPRARAFEKRKQCYMLIQNVLHNLDAACAHEPDTIDGKRTLIAIKRDEAYAVVNESTDEVFHSDLYDWYVQQGLTDRLLSIESPHVIRFLETLAATDVGHADLLCRYYTLRGRFYDAARVQAELARSAFPISIKDRIQLLSRAKTNASVITTGIARQDLQMLNHEVTELLEVAHIQDDLFERLKVDPRIPPERIPEIESTLDGEIQSLSDLFNQYADNAGYYDICLLIYYAADFRNPTTIAQTWNNLIQQTHDEVMTLWDQHNNALRTRTTVPEDAPAQPYETLCTVIQDVRHRVTDDSFIFPVPTLLPEVCRYSLENQQDRRINADPSWPVVLFLNLNTSHDLVVRVLEGMFDGQDVPFRGQARLRVVEWILYAVRSWMREVQRSGRSEGLPPWVSEMLAGCETFMLSARGANDGGMETQQLAREVREMKRSVDGFAVVGRGSFASSMGYL